MKKNFFLLIYISLFAFFVGSLFYYQYLMKPVSQRIPATVDTNNDYFLNVVDPIFQSRCTICHSCYNAPCQLKLTSFEGIERGATKHQIYDGTRLTAMHPTRLYIDAKTAEEWHTKYDFFPIITHDPTKVEQSIMYKMLLLQREYRKTIHFDHKLPTTFAGKAEESRQCPRDEKEFAKYSEDYPTQGMPFGCPEIENDKYKTLLNWLKSGAPGPSQPASEILESITNTTLINKWETFFNDNSIKTKITARYLYEHLFLAHIYFDEMPGEFYRLVRSYTNYPHTIDEINTTLPYDDPGHQPFFYRFRKITETIVDKDHIVYHLNNNKMRRYRELFLDIDWQHAELLLPSYDSKIATNPFLAFQQIPPRSRYQFLLDDAQYTIMTFIKGPVCRGPTALNVINDHFFVAFMDPDIDVATINPVFLNQVKNLLQMPNQATSKHSMFIQYAASQKKYWNIRADYYKTIYPNGLALDAIWDGDGINDNAFLTIYRHYDSGVVVKGAVGGIPQNMLILDYPILERIYYLLVAGFNVFGDIVHQINTRRFMDLLRIEGEDNFLTFLPKESRQTIRKSWYQSLLAEMALPNGNKFLLNKYPTRIPFQTTDPVKEMYDFILTKRLPKDVRSPIDTINYHPPRNKIKIDKIIATEDELDQKLADLAAKSEPFVTNFPDLAFLKVIVPDKDALVYSIVRNRYHKNIKFMFFEENRLNPDKDTLNFIKGFIGSYPNFFFVVNMQDITLFLADMISLKKHDKHFQTFIARYGIRREDPRMWSVLDWFHTKYLKDDPIAAGYFDINRYENY